MVACVPGADKEKGGLSDRPPFILPGTVSQAGNLHPGQA